MDIRAGGWALWAVAAALVVVVAVMLYIFVPSSSPDGVPEPTSTPVTTSEPTATARPTDTAGPLPTGTSGIHPTGTPGPHPTGQPGNGPTGTPGPQPTPTVLRGSGEVYFSQSSYTVDEGEQFTTRIRVGFPLDYFYGAQFDLEYDHDVIRLRVDASAEGTLYDTYTSNWTIGDTISITLQGTGPNSQGKALVLQTWDDYAAVWGRGVNATDGYLCDIYWVAQDTEGTTDIRFTGKTTLDRDLARLHPSQGASSILPSAWFNTTVTVQ